MHRMRPEYAKIVGDYDSVEDMCNQRGLNDYEDDDEDDEYYDD